MTSQEENDRFNYGVLGIAVAGMLDRLKHSDHALDKIFLHDFLDQLEQSNPEIVADLAACYKTGTL